MQPENHALPPAVNHVFVDFDFENVHEIDAALFGNKTVSLTLLLGPRQTKLDVSLVEKLLARAAFVQLVRLTSTGRNALDFTLAYYVGRAVLADPTGYFHIISRDKGYDPLVEHLRSKHIHAHRHDDFTTLNFTRVAKPPTATTPPPAAATPPVTPQKPKPQTKPKAQPPVLDERAAQVQEHYRKPSATRPKNREKLVSFLVAHFGHKISEEDAAAIIESLRKAGHLTFKEKDAVSYHLQLK